MVLEKGRRITVRSAPEIRDVTVIGSFPAGDSFPYLGESGDWFQISLPSGESAWVNRNFARVETIPDAVRVTGSAVAVFAEPDPSSSVIANLESGRVLNQVSSQDGWVQVEYRTNRRGWVRSESLESLGAANEVQTEPDAESPAAVAEKPSGEEPIPTGGETSPEGTGTGGAEEAIRSYRYILGMNPDDGVAHFELGSALERLGQLEEARTHFRRAADLGERSDEALRRAAAISDQIVVARQESLPVTPKTPDVTPKPSPEQSSPSEETWSQNQLLVIVAAICLVVAGGSIWYFRSRKVRNVERLLRLGQGFGESSDLTSSRDFLKQLEAARSRQQEVGNSLDRRFQELKKVLAPAVDPSGGTADEAHLKRINEVGKFIEEQQARINALSDLLSLQNEKLAAEEEEIKLLRKLLTRN